MSTRSSRSGSTRLITRYRFLFTPRWLTLLLVAALSVPGCSWLAGWQFDRLRGAQHRNDRIERNTTAPPVTVTEIAPAGSTVGTATEWRTVTASGRYDVEHQVFVRNRPRDGVQSFQVVTPLITGSGTAVLVNRGSIPAPLNGESPAVPGTPTGNLTVTGNLRATETGVPVGGSDLPAGQVLGIDVARLTADLPYDAYAGYLQLAAQDPAPPVIAGRYVPDPLELPGSRSELLHRSYAWQWYLFAAIGPIGVGLLARREAADRSTCTPDQVSALHPPESRPLTR